MTDEEIEKALECCSKSHCRECSFFKSKTDCVPKELEKTALDYINRLKAKINELQTYIKQCESGEAYWVKCLLDRPKDTAKEILQDLKTICKERSRDYTDWSGKEVQAVVCDWLFTDIADMAKQYGVEVDE